MHPLEVIIRLAVRGHHQVKVPGAHVQGLEPGAHHGVGPGEGAGGEHGGALTAVLFHDLQPADVFFRGRVVDDVRAVHAGGGMQRGIRLVGLGRDDQAQILPVIQIPGFIHAHAPVPNAVFPVGLFLVLAVPIVFAVLVENGAAVGLNALALGVQPNLAGPDAGIHEMGLLFYFLFWEIRGDFLLKRNKLLGKGAFYGGARGNLP